MFSLIDPELSLLAENMDRFTEIGVTPIVSSYELCETSLDKYQMYEMLVKLGIPTAKCYLSIEDFENAMSAGEVSYPVFVKPRRGSASININAVESKEMLIALFHDYDDLIIQEYMQGQEYGADVYIDMISGKCTSIFLKEKIKMRAGETDKSVSVKDERLFEQIVSFVETVGYRGMIDIDLFYDNATDTWYLSEVNPRFGVEFYSGFVTSLTGCHVTMRHAEIADITMSLVIQPLHQDLDCPFVVITDRSKAFCVTRQQNQR